MLLMEEKMEEEISLGEILAIFKQHIGKIVLWSLMGLIVAGIYTFFFVTPSYQSTSKIVVNQTQNSSQSITNTDIQTNLNLINTYQSIIQEPIILEDVITATDSDLSIEELRSKITIETQNNSLVFGIIVSDKNPYIAADLANSISTSFENKIGNILEVESVTILSEAIPNLTAVSPNIIINLVLGLIIGLMIGMVISIISEMMNKTIKDDKFIEQLGWTNLGSILEMSTEEVTNTRINAIKNHRPVTDSLTRRRV